MNFNNLIDLILENVASRKFSCLMLSCPEQLETLKEIQSKIDPQDIWEEKPGHGLEAQPHITVLYGFHTNLFRDVLNTVNLKPVSYRLDKISSFNNKQFDVLKFDVSSPDLHVLNSESKKLEYTNRYPIYQPHLTIAYLQPGTAEKYKKLFPKELGRKVFTSNKFEFSDKEGNLTYYSV